MSTFFRLLPAVAFFALLGIAAWVGYRFGVSSAASTSASDAGEVIYTCSMHLQVRQSGPGLCPICHMELEPLSAVEDDEGPGIRIDPVVVQNMGVRTVPAVRGRLERSIRAFGVLRVAEPRLRDVTLKVSGIVEELFADTEGMRVERGDPLFAIYAPELIVAQEELIAAVASGDAELIATARQKLRLWDVPEEIIDRIAAANRSERTLILRSPVDGVLLRRDVVAGAAAAANQALMRIADLSVLWLDAQVPESQIVGIEVGQRATASFGASRAASVAGEVIFVSPQLDEQTRTATVRVAIPNPMGTLMPGMFARTSIESAAIDQVVLVPSEAVLDTGRRQIVWIALGNGRFEAREPRIGPSGDGGLLVIDAGITPGEHVVVSGQFLIDSESRLREGTRKMSDDGLIPGGDQPKDAPRVELDGAAQAAVDATLQAYLALADELALERDAPAARQQLQRAAAVLVDALPAALAPDARALHEALHGEEAAAVHDLATRRVTFIAVSDAAIALFRVARPSVGPGDALHVMHCPMVPAAWLQADATLRNPYYGAEMLACGEETAVMPLASSPLDADTQALVDELLRRYLAVTAELALDHDAAADWAGLKAAAAGLHRAAPARSAPAFDLLHGALNGPDAPPAGDRETRRAALVAVSDAVIGLFRVVRPSRAVGDELHVMHCPMFPGDWLQTDESLRNPYYGAAMLECGERTEALPLVDRSDK